MEFINNIFIGYFIEFRFDDDSANRIKSIWQNIESSLSGSDMHPHISLCSVGDIDEVTLKNTVEQFCKTIKSFQLQFGLLGTFPTNEGVLFISPVITKELIDNQRLFSQMLTDAGIEVKGYYMPDKWIPHCTLDINLSEYELKEKFSLIHQEEFNIKVNIESVAVTKYFPAENVGVYRICEGSIL